MCSLAIATELGGVKIYKLLPAEQTPAVKQVSSQHRGVGRQTQAPATLALRHDIMIKNMSKEVINTEDKLSSVGDKQTAHFSHVPCLSTQGSLTSKTRGNAVLVGVVEGRHLCVWDMLTGVTLLTAQSVAPSGFTVDEVVWYGSAALVGLRYSAREGSKRVDVHQLDVAGQDTFQVSEQGEKAWCVRSEMNSFRLYPEQDLVC